MVHKFTAMAQKSTVICQQDFNTVLNQHCLIKWQLYIETMHKIKNMMQFGIYTEVFVLSKAP